MKTKYLFFVPIVMALVFSTAEARRGNGGRGQGADRVMSELNLTQEQKEKIKAERQKRKTEMDAARDKAKAAREKLREGFKNNASNDQLRALRSEVQGAQMSLGNARFEGMLAIRDILTPEQRAKFNAWHESRQGRGGGGPDESDDE